MTRLMDRLRVQGERFDREASAVALPQAASGLAGLTAPPVTDPGLEELGAVAAVRQSLLREQPGLLEEGGADRSRLRSAIDTILCRDNIVVPARTRDQLTEIIGREIAGFGPLESLLADPEVTDIMVNGPAEVFFERAGVLHRSELAFAGHSHLRDTVGRIIGPLGRRLDNLNPFVDLRLPDGSRLNVIIPPLAPQGWTITIRRFRSRPLTLDDLSTMGMLSAATVRLLRAITAARLNLVVAGGAGSGKTTLLNAACMCIQPGLERLITIEDAQELSMEGVHVIHLEARPPNLEGLGEVTIRQLVRNALRMRPDRLVIGEVRDAAAYDFLLAINTGHAGSMCTIHANSAADALYRLENLALTSGSNIVLRAVRDQIAKAVDIALHLVRDDDGRRRLAEIGVLAGSQESGDEFRVYNLAGGCPAEREKAAEALLARCRRRGHHRQTARVMELAREVCLEAGAEVVHDDA